MLVLERVLQEIPGLEPLLRDLSGALRRGKEPPNRVHFYEPVHRANYNSLERPTERRVHYNLKRPLEPPAREDRSNPQGGTEAIQQNLVPRRIHEMEELARENVDDADYHLQEMKSRSRHRHYYPPAPRKEDHGPVTRSVMAQERDHRRWESSDGGRPEVDCVFEPKRVRRLQPEPQYVPPSPPPDSSETDLIAEHLVRYRIDQMEEYARRELEALLAELNRPKGDGRIWKRPEIKVYEPPVEEENLEDLMALSSAYKPVEPMPVYECAQCHKPILGKCVTAMFKKFHPEHFACSFCLKPLTTGTFKEEPLGEKPYCHACFEKLYS